MRGAQAVAETLAVAGTGYVFGLPGTGNLELLDAVGAHSGLKFVSTRHEQAAAFMADGYARASGRFGVCTASRSSAANMALAVQNAYQDCSPVVALLGQVSRKIRHYETAEQIDLVALLSPITKLCINVPQAPRVAELVRWAIGYSMAGRPRPVAVLVPMDIMTEEADFECKPPSLVHPPRGDLDGLRRCLEILCSASRPLILAGGGVVRARATDGLVELAKLLNAPVVTTFQRKDAFPNHHPLFAGMESETESVGRALLGADVMLAVGCKFAGGAQLAAGLRLLHIDVDAGALGRRYPTEVAVQADARLAMLELAQMARDARELVASNTAQRTAWAAEVCEAYRQATGPATHSVAGTTDKVDWPSIVRMLQPSVDHGATVTVDQGAFAFHGVYRHLWFQRPGSLLAPVGGAMGFAFPASLGAQLALPERKILCLCGDGGFAMALPDLETAVRYHLPVVTIVANNCAYGLIAGKQRSSYDGRYVGSKLGKCDFAAIAEAIGARGVRVESTADFKPALDAALTSGEPAVIDVILKPPL